ncbi:MAG: hypothetical protein AAGC55_02350, partial [Myxococcota bacterium]
YNTDGFVEDDRPELEYAAWSGEPCMENCKDAVEITMRATRLNVTLRSPGPRVSRVITSCARFAESSTSRRIST